MKKKAVTVDASTEGQPSTPVVNQPVPVRTSPGTMISGHEGITRQNRHVLPEQCIICKRQEMYKLDKVQ